MQARNDSYRFLFAPVALIGFIHIGNGLTIFLSPEAAEVSALSGPMLTGASPYAIATILIGVGIAALLARLLVLSETLATALIAPQQIVLLVQLVGIMVALWRGFYPDGYAPSENWWDAFVFILGDQFAWIVLCLSHSLELLFAKTLTMDWLTRHYEARLAERDEDLADAQRELGLYRDTRFWMELGRENAAKG
jgi:hypothetical protein